VRAAQRLGHDLVADAERFRSRAVSLSASAALSFAVLADRHRIAAHPSGEITE
jgi:hypothetical protein